MVKERFLSDENKKALKKLRNDIKKKKKKLVKKAIRKDGLWENFGRKEQGELEDKDYGFSSNADEVYSNELNKFFDWRTNFDLGKLRRAKKAENLEEVL